MEEKEIEKYKKYQVVRNKDKVNWFDRIKYWDFIKKELESAKIENTKKQSKIRKLEQELSATQISLNIAHERIEQLEYDLKQKEKKTRKVKKQTK